MFTNLIAISVLVFFIYRGYKKGFIGASLSLFSLIVGYAAAFFGYRPLAQWFIAGGYASGFQAYVVGGLLAFFGTQLVLFIPGALINRSIKRKAKEGRIRPSYWVLGGFVGTVSGVFFAILVVWAAMLYQAAQKKNDPVPALSKMPSLSEQVTTRTISFVTRRVLEARRKNAPDKTAKSSFSSQAMDNVLVKVLSQPDQGVYGLKMFFENPKLNELLESRDFQHTLMNGGSQDIENHPNYQELFQDEAFLRSARDLGLVNENTQMSEIQKEMSQTLVGLRSRMDQIVKNPEVVAMLKKPEFKEKIEKRDMIALMTDDDFNRILELAFETPIAGEKFYSFQQRQEWKFFSAGPEGLMGADPNRWFPLTLNPEGFTPKQWKKTLQEGLERARLSMFVYRPKKELMENDPKALLKLAELGHGSAQFGMAMKYANGWGVPLDKEAALNFMKIAANNKEAPAQFHLAAMYALGWNGTREMDRAANWLEKSLAQGFAKAEYCFGLAHTTPSRTHPQTLMQYYPQSIEKALSSLQSAAKKDIREAYLVLGLLYAIGESVPQDLAKAHSYFKMAEKKDIRLGAGLWNPLLKQMSANQHAKAREYYAVHEKI
jgi:hypothetical protein